MMRVEELLTTITVLEQRDLEVWIAEELVVPEGGAVFSAQQVARVRLLCALRYEMDVAPDSLAVVMSLIDQLYETRAQLLSLTAAITAQDPEVRATILRHVAGEE